MKRLKLSTTIVILWQYQVRKKVLQTEIEDDNILHLNVMGRSKSSFMQMNLWGLDITVEWD